MIRLVLLIIKAIKKFIKFIFTYYALVYLVSLIYIFDDLYIGQHVIGIISIYLFTRKHIIKHVDNLFVKITDVIFRVSMYVCVLVYPVAHAYYGI